MLTAPRDLRRLIAALTLLVAFAAAAPRAAAWSDAGHEVVATVAWERLSPEVRAEAVALLRAAPDDSGIAELAPDGRDRLHFVRAATWPDLVKRLPRHPYDRRHWHYVNHYWHRGEGGEAEPVPRLRPRRENAEERVRHFAEVLADGRRSEGERAVALAWLLHLVGDLHQPLHASARVTAEPDEAKGDRGGNAVLLHTESWFSERRVNLHGYWDRIFDNARGARFWESRKSWVDRLAEEAVTEWPRSRLPEATEADPGRWARESLGLAQAVVYPGIVRGRQPPSEYEERALATSRRATALAGYRLADLLQAALARGNAD